jgi:hypothetical protein
MILLAVLLLALVTVPVAQGRLARLADIELRHLWAIGVALGLQILIISVFPDRFEWTHEPLHIGSYVFAAVFVWANRRLPGMLVMGLGALCNAVAIVANGGVMPASETAMRAAGLAIEKEGFANSAPVEDANLLFLGDIFSIPDSWPIIDNVFSVGDVLIALGAVILIHSVCGSRLVPARLRRASVPA